MKYLSIIILSFSLLLSCKKPKDRVEKREDENTVQELVYRNDSLVQATNFTKNGNISYKVKYKKGIISEIKDYYPSGKSKIETKLIWSEDNQNYYIEKAYYTNGKLEYEGEVNIINDKKNSYELENSMNSKNITSEYYKNNIKNIYEFIHIFIYFI